MLQKFFNHFIDLAYAQITDRGVYEEHLAFHKARFLGHTTFFLGHTVLTKLLINDPLFGVNKFSFLFWACEKGFLNAVKTLLHNGININETNDYWRKTLLHVAAKEGHIALAEFLIEKGIFINATDIDKNTALHLALKKNHTTMVQLLIKKGAAINAVNIYDNTALHIACFNGHIVLAKLLIEKGAAVNVANISGYMPLHTACSKGLIPIVTLLLEKKVAINAVTINGKTALHLALEKNHIALAKLIILSLLKKSKEKKPDFIKEYTVLSAYWDEILALKEMISGRITLFDFYIMNNINKLEIMAADLNQEMQCLIYTESFTNKYLFFGNKIKENFEKGLLADKAFNTLSKLKFDKRRLPPELWKKVLTYLNNLDDLKNVAFLFSKSKSSSEFTNHSQPTP